MGEVKLKIPQPDKCLGEPFLGAKQNNQLAADRNSNCPSCLTLLGLGFLTFNSGMAIHRSRDDPWSVAFVISSFLDLILLFVCLQKFEKTPRGSPLRFRLKVAVWCLSTFLTVMFSYRVAALMPLAVAIIVWVMSLSTIGAGFYLFFVYKEEVEDVAPADAKPV
jgi:drug/metabolite transporter (DMT)-like permease